MQSYLSAAIKFALATIVMLTLGFVQDVASRRQSREPQKKSPLSVYSEGTYRSKVQIGETTACTKHHIRLIPAYRAESRYDDTVPERASA